jgi:ribosome-associated protein
MFGAGLPTPSKRPTEGLLSSDVRQQPNAPSKTGDLRSAVSTGSGDPRRTRRSDSNRLDGYFSIKPTIRVSAGSLLLVRWHSSATGTSDLTAMKANTVTTPEAAPITLDQFLKTTGLVGTGGQAKIAIQEGYVTVNGELETRRRRKLALGDVIVVDNEHKFVVTEEAIRRF